MARQRFIDWDKINDIIEQRKQAKIKIDETFTAIKDVKRGDKRPLYETIAALRKARAVLAKQIRDLRENKSKIPLIKPDSITKAKKNELSDAPNAEVKNADITIISDNDDIESLDLEIQEMEHELDIDK